MSEGTSQTRPAAEDGFCLFCGYALRGLPTAICPECGRAFDPHNPRTFDRAPRRSHRRRRRAILAVVVLGLLAYGLWPRGSTTCSVTFGCPNCVRTLTVRRTQPVLVSWLRFRPPGWVTRETGAGGPKEASQPACPDHRMGDMIVALDLPRMKIGGSSPGGSIHGHAVINGMLLTPDTAGDVLAALMSAGPAGMTMALQPVPGNRPPPESSGAEDE